MSLHTLLQPIIPKTKREKGYLAAGVMVLALSVGSYVGYRAIERKYPHVVQRILGDNNKIDCPIERKIEHKLDVEQLSLEEMVTQTIFTTPSHNGQTRAGFLYLTPADTTAVKDGQKVFPKKIVQKRICVAKKSGEEERDIPLFIGDEGEGGYVTRIELDLPPAELLGKYYEGEFDEQLQQYPSLLTAQKLLPNKEERCKKLKQRFTNAAILLKDMHIDYVFAPVIDVVRDINAKENLMSEHDRAYSSNPETVISLAKMYIQAMHAQKIKVIAKHYFGTGFTTTDPHKDLPKLSTLSEEENKKVEQPFRELVYDLDGIMVTHIVHDNNKKPDSLNEEAYRYLRKIGFNGIIITDDLYMGAIENLYSYKEEWLTTATLEALAAGADGVILKYPDEWGKISLAIVEKMKKDAHFKQQRFESFERLMKFKDIVLKKDTSVAPQMISSTFKRGDTFIAYLAGELGTKIVDEKGNLLPIKKGPLAQYYEHFKKDNGEINLQKLRTDMKYVFRDYNGNGKIDFTDPTKYQN